MAKKQGIVYHPPREYNWRGEGYFTIQGVVDRGETTTYVVAPKMTPGLNQDKLAELYEREKQAENPHPTSAPLLQTIINRAYVIRNVNPQDSERFRVFLQNGLRRYPHTLTRITFNPEGQLDQVTHNHGTSDAYSIEGNIVGPDGWMVEIPDKKVLESLTGTKRVSQINRTYQWINKTNGYLWRLNSKPTQKDERVARFDAGHDRFFLCCGRHPLYVCPAFRVLRVE